MATSYQQTYDSRLKTGQAYQDWIAYQLLREGIVLVNFQTQAAQYAIGENQLGLEIKFDDKLATTGNVWIEVAEKTNPANATFAKSGIYRVDNSWLYGIGNYDEFFIFSKRMLQLLHQSERWPVIENGTKTSRGFLLSRETAARYVAKCVTWADDHGTAAPVDPQRELTAEDIPW